MGQKGFGGGAIFSLEDACRLRISECSFMGNVAAASNESGGRGMCVQSPAARVDLEATTFECNECTT